MFSRSRPHLPKVAGPLISRANVFRPKLYATAPSAPDDKHAYPRRVTGGSQTGWNHTVPGPLWGSFGGSRMTWPSRTRITRPVSSSNSTKRKQGSRFLSAFRCLIAAISSCCISQTLLCLFLRSNVATRCFSASFSASTNGSRTDASCALASVSNASTSCHGLTNAAGSTGSGDFKASCRC